MKNWTTQAERRLNDYLAERCEREGFSGDDAAELKDDLRRHIHEEAGKLPGDTLSLMALEELLGRLDSGYRPPAAPPPAGSAGKRPRRFWSWTAGVVLPVLVLVFEPEIQS